MFDLQVNGYAGVDFNQDDLRADDLHRACECLEADGTGQILATVITEDVDRMCTRLANLARLRAGDPLAARVIAGFHIEGPFINETPGFRGAHPADAVRPGDVDVMNPTEATSIDVVTAIDVRRAARLFVEALTAEA